ncbi:MAG: pyridine nucleotide-disulfide oxidoreductase family protein [Bradyrhizobium sp.]|jgi:ferredoxin--NADP+ reductase|nr:pyridine nucleotide-disulfide oxidoreductase family protein [Bradyrhizobium sp.]MEA2866767.1 ferredoxin/flavodoxin---NADP+ reductase [Bradyrhizobium sp.]
MTHPDIAIVGSGPSGFFAAEAILKSGIDARVHMFDRLPTPYGLVRSGVAPDHQHIKQVIKVFDTISRNPNFSFFGNVEIGGDITLDALRARYDALILAYGASAGTPLSIPGADLPQSLTATEFVGWYNGHPDHAGLAPRFDHHSAVVIGHGNVGIDIARVLLSDHARLAKTDIADHALESLGHSRVRKVHLVGRRGPAQASFTTAELRELLGMPDVQAIIDPQALAFDAEECAFLELPGNAAIKRNIAVLQEAAAHRVSRSAVKELHLHFLTSPTAVEGTEQVAAVQFVRNQLEGRIENRRAVAGGETYSVPAGLAIASIGFQGRPLGNVPFDERRGVIPNIEGRVVCTVPERLAPLYVAGWIKRGPNGVIGTNRADAVETVRSLLSDFRDGRWSAKPDDKRSRLPLKETQVDFAAWKLIDEAECQAGQAAGRPRRKFVDIDAMLEVARAGQASAGKLAVAG